MRRDPSESVRPLPSRRFIPSSEPVGPPAVVDQGGIVPSVYAIPLSGPDWRAVRPWQMHAELSRLLGHATNDWSLRLLPEAAGPRAGLGVPAISLEVSVLSVALERALPVALAAGTELRLTDGTTTQTATVTGEPTVVTQASWPELAIPFPAGPATSWEVTFHTPAAVSQGEHNFPLLSGDALLLSLLKRWQSLTDVRDGDLEPGGGPVPVPNLFELASRHWGRDARANLRIVDLRGHTETVFIPRRHGLQTIREVVPGFVGVVRLLALDPTVAALTDCLLRFGEFSGVGVGVRYGLGSLSVRPVWR